SISGRTDPQSPIISHTQIDLVINSDDEVRCKYSPTATTYNDMQSEFPGFDDGVFRQENRLQVATTTDGTFSYKVACENKASLVSPVITISYTVNKSARGSILSVGPSGSTQATSVTLEARTNKDANCTYDYNSNPYYFSSSDSKYHTASLNTPNEGIYAIPVRCLFTALGGATSRINFKVDRTAPTMDRVNDGVYSCSLTQASATFEASDNLSDIDGYEYQLMQGTTLIASGNTTAASVTITGLNLTLNENYYVKARAKDAAGNWGTFEDGDGFLATYANRTECQDTGPPRISFVRNTTSEGSRVSIICNDETGCTSISYGTAATLGNCSPVLTYQTPILVTTTTYVCAQAFDIMNNAANASIRVFVGDDDSDGVTNTADKCPNTQAGEVVNANGCSNRQLSIDTDGDRLPDWWEILYGDLGCALNYQDDDSDADGITDDLEDYNGNEILNFEEYQEDDDPCEIVDSDNDGIADYLDNCDNTPASEINQIITDENSSDYGCGPSEIFSLGDGIDDGWRLKYFGCIECPQAAADFDYDEDGLTNLEEYNLKDFYGESTDPTNEDTDGDGYDDKKEVDNGWDPTDPNSPVKEKSIVLPIILLILGLLMVAGGIGYLVFMKFQKIPARPAMPARPSIRVTRPMPRPIVRPRPAPVPGRYAELIAKRKAERQRQRREKIRGLFSAFTGKKEPLPKLTKIMTKEEKTPLERLTAATHHYLKKKEEIAPKLSGKEKDVFEELAEKIKKPTKTEVKKFLKKKPKEEIHDTFNKLMDIVGKHSGNDFEKLKKYGKKK
ncbi:thrombospondin type 3 repeat-containing protein, partial [Candidatus Woesearchaeota archaeon]|nr:thrombospondin type 3 repeat-containing protein [Candidatus Woesearchaeota archaeon]